MESKRKRLELVRSGKRDSTNDVFPRAAIESLPLASKVKWVTVNFSDRIEDIVGAVDWLEKRELEDGELAIDAECILWPTGLDLVAAGAELALGAFIHESKDQPDGTRLIERLEARYFSLTDKKVK